MHWVSCVSATFSALFSHSFSAFGMASLAFLESVVEAGEKTLGSPCSIDCLQ